MATQGEVGGVSNHVISSVKQLKKIGHNCIVLIELDNILNQFEAVAPTFVVSFHSKNPQDIIKNYKVMLCLCEKYSIDIMHSHYRSCSLYFDRISKKRGIPYVWTNHLCPISSSPIHRLLTRYGAYAIAIGVDTKEFLINKLRISSDRVKLIYHGIELKRYYQSETRARDLKALYGIPDSNKVICILSRLNKVKGHLFLLEAMKGCNDNITYLFTGDGPKEYKNEILRYKENNRIKGQIIFTGHIDSIEALSMSDICVLPSSIEGFGIVALESFAMRVPFIRTKTAGYRDMEEECLCVDYGDSNALRVVVNIALEHGDEIIAMVDHAYKKVLNEWNIENMGNNLVELYKECIGNN